MARIDAGAVARTSALGAPVRDRRRRRATRSSTRCAGHHVVDVRLEPDVPVRLDPRLTAAALAHLLENAAQYTPPGSPIEVHARRASGRVPDRTCAITARASRRRICRTCSSASIAARGAKGAGVRHRHGPVASPAVCWRPQAAGSGRRTRRTAARIFTIAGARGGAGGGRAAVAASDGHAARILLVDDEAAIQRAVAPLLRARGYEVEVAGTGVQSAASSPPIGRPT